MGRRCATRLFGTGVVMGLLLLAAAPAALAGTRCPTTVGSSFASAKELERLVTEENSFGPRILGSEAHNQTIEWIQDELGDIDGFKVRTDAYELYRWQPLTKMKNGKGLDIAAAGAITVTRPDGSTADVPDAGAVRFSKPTSATGQSGPLAYVPTGQEITAANAAGKVVIRDFPNGSLPYSVFQLIDLYLTPDLAKETGDYQRPYLSGGPLDADLLDAGQAGAAGVVFAFDVPGEQVGGYYDPHTGTKYGVPGVFVGRAESEQLKALAAQGGSAAVAVRAKLDRAPSRNVIATLPGRSAQKIAIFANTDGNSWVQENGVAGMLALGRYYASLPISCRPRTLELGFTTAHDAIVEDGAYRYGKQLDRQYGQGKLSFAFGLEHLGTRELLPTGEGASRRLAFTGKGDPFLFAAGDSDALRRAAVAATKRRKLDRTAVLRGVGIPNEAQAPPICSMGGLGTFPQRALIPTLAMISGPWTLYDPAFGSRAIDFKRMRSQLLAAGDAVLALDGVSQKQIDGDYTEYRKQRAQGKPGCPAELYPQFGPGATPFGPGAGKLGPQ
jgi:hypothetical protein